HAYPLLAARLAGHRRGGWLRRCWWGKWRGPWHRWRDNRRYRGGRLMSGEIRLDVVLGDLAAAARSADFLQVDVPLGGDAARQWRRMGAVGSLTCGDPLALTLSPMGRGGNRGCGAVAGGGRGLGCRLCGGRCFARWLCLLLLRAHLRQRLAHGDGLALALDDAAQHAIRWSAHLDV